MTESVQLQNAIGAGAKGLGPQLAGGSASVKPESRRLLTVLCYDLVGSTEMLAEHGVEIYHELIAEYQANVTRAVTLQSGRMYSDSGDGGVAVFPVEIDAKDAAMLAIHAGLDIVTVCTRQQVRKEMPAMQVRVGIATSVALLQGSVTDAAPAGVTSLAMAMATRLQSLAEANSVLVSHETRTLARKSYVFRSIGEHLLKGFPSPQAVWEVVRHRADSNRFLAFGRMATRFVNREEERRQFAGLWQRAVAGTGSVMLLSGDAGIGKSRTFREMCRQARPERHRLLMFQCVPGGAKTALYPLLQAIAATRPEFQLQPSAGMLEAMLLRQGVDDREVLETFSFLLGVGGGSANGLGEASRSVMEERFERAVRRFVELTCNAGPVIIGVEDVQWCDDTFKRLLTIAAGVAESQPLLLLITARPNAVTDWQGLPQLRHVPLRPLRQGEIQAITQSMLAGSCPPELLDIITRVAGGIPLFTEEICQWVLENPGAGSDQLTKVVSPGAVSVLENIVDVRLAPLGSARDVIRVASVIGHRIGVRLLEEIMPEFGMANLQQAIDRLTGAGLLVSTRPGSPDSYAFRHALIQETIYTSLLGKERKNFHRRLLLALLDDRDIAPWISTAALAEHAERAEEYKLAVELCVAAGRENSSRSAMSEARLILEHAFTLCDAIADTDTRETLKLSVYAALGPVITGTDGPASPSARKLYEDGVRIARMRPPSERAALFPIYWGWWFTGEDVTNARAQSILAELADVDDPEVQLQVRHCVWAIDFYLGRHESCIKAVTAGLPYYQPDKGRESATLYGGHDARVCGLVHRGLSEWLTGQPARAARSINEARQQALAMGHIGSIAHALYNEALFHTYRRDFQSLRSVVADIQDLTAKNSLFSLEASTDIFLGWCEGNAGNIATGQEMIRQGLAVHARLQTPEDYLLYAGMLAELMARSGDCAAALEFVGNAGHEAQRSGHHYWLAEIHRRKAAIMYQGGFSQSEVLQALHSALEIASAQNAVPLLLNVFDCLAAWDLSPETVARYADRIKAQRLAVPAGEVLIVNPEPLPHRHTAGIGTGR